jgi:hypothetical protein
MTDQAAIPQALRKLLQTLRRHPKDSAVGTILHTCLPGGLDADALDWLIRRARDEVSEIVFRYEAYGYVVIGLAGQEQVHVDPQLSGLDLAHEIFTHGITSASTMQVNANAARNALARAADWAEPRCPQLARAIREISIKDGRPIFSPAHKTKISVF